MEENTELKTFLLEGATRLKAFCDKHNVTITPYQTPSEALYQGFKTGVIMSDFTEFMEHAVNEIKAFRKKTRKGRKHFNFERNPDYVLSLLNGR